MQICRPSLGFLTTVNYFLSNGTGYWRLTLVVASLDSTIKILTWN